MWGGFIVTQETFGKIMTLIEQSRSFRFTPEEQQTWWILLEPLEDETAVQATGDMLRTVEGRITPAHLWNRAKAIERDRPLPRLPMLDEPLPSEGQVARGRAVLRAAREKIGRRIQ